MTTNNLINEISYYYCFAIRVFVSERGFRSFNYDIRVLCLLDLYTCLYDSLYTLCGVRVIVIVIVRSGLDLFILIHFVIFTYRASVFVPFSIQLLISQILTYIQYKSIVFIIPIEFMIFAVCLYLFIWNHKQKTIIC